MADEFDPQAFLKETAPSGGDGGFDPQAFLKETETPSFGQSALDVAKQIPTGIVTGFEGLVTGVPRLLGAAAEYLPEGDPERAAEQKKIRELAQEQGGAKGIGQYLPEPTTPAGKYARTAAEMGTGALAAPGKLAVTVPAAVTGGLTSEAAGQLLDPYDIGDVGRVAGALAGSAGVLGIVKAIKPAVGQESVIAGRLARALARDRDSPESLMQRLEETRQYRPDATIADVAGDSTRDLLETVAQTPGGRAVAKPILEQRQGAQARRIANDLAETGNVRQSAYEALQGTLEQRKTEARPLYQRAYADGDFAIWSPELERLSGANPVKRAMRTAVRDWQDQQIADGYGAMNPGALVDRPGQAGGLLSMTGGKVPVFPNLQFWDYVKNALDTQYKRSVRITGPTKESARIAEYLTRLRGQLDVAVPSYGQARSVYAGRSAYLDALEDGKGILNRNMTAEELAAQFRDMSEAEREAYRIGAVGAIRNKMQSNPAKLPDFTRDIRSEEMRRKLLVMAPTPQAAVRLQQALSYEIGASEITGQALGQSATARRLQAKEDAEGMVGELATHLALSKFGAGWIAPLWRFVSQPVRRAAQKASDRGVAQLMLSTEPTAEIAPRTRTGRPTSTVPGTARGVGLGLINQQLQYTPEGYPYVQGGQGAQTRQQGGTVPTIGGGRRRPLGTRALIAISKARARKSQALQDGRAQRFRQTGGEVKPKSHERLASMLQGSPGAGGIFPTQPQGQAKPKAPAAPSEMDIARTLRSQGISGEQAGGFAGAEFGPKVIEQYQDGGEVKGDESRSADAPRAQEEPWIDPMSGAPANEESLRTIGRGIGRSIYGVLSMPNEFARSYIEGARGVAEGDPEEAEKVGRGNLELLGMMTGMPKPAGALGAGAMRTTRVPGQTQRGIASVNLRQMPIEEALPIARSERHIIPKGEEGEGFIGAPLTVKTRADLERMRNDFDAQVEEGMAGAPWYQTAQSGIKEMAGADPARQHMLAREKALFSAQSTPDVNLGYTLQAHNAFQAGVPRPLVRTGQQARTYNEARAAGVDIPLGAKTDVYAGHLDPTMEDPITGTNDIWHARAFGYTRKNGKPWDGALTQQQHAFMDAETMLAVDRANARALGGRSDWTAGEIQAAPWVARKTQGLMEQFGWPYAKAREEAIKTYNAFFDKYTAYGTHEATPGVGIGHLPYLAEGPAAERRAWAEMPASSWANPEGRDVLYEAAGMYQRPILPAQGIFQGPRGLEFNPAAVSRPMVSMGGKSGERTIDPASYALLRGVEGSRAYIDAQNMGAFSMPIFNQKIGEMTSVWLPTTRPLTLEQVAALRAEGAKLGLPEVIDYSNGAALTSYGEMPKGAKLSRDIRPGSPSAVELERIAGVAPRQTKLVPGSIDYEEALAGPQGTGMATRILQKALQSEDAPALIGRLDSNLELRTKVMERLNRDAEYRARTGQPMRADLQRARRIIARDGFAGLFRALRAGVALPAAVVVPALSALRQETSPVE